MTFGTLMDLFGFEALFTPEILLIVGLVGTYYCMTVEAESKHKLLNQSERRKRRIYFLVGCFLFYIGFGGPLTVLGHLLFSAHMLQQSILYLAMPPLILAGLPEGFYHKIMSNRVFGFVIRLFTQPIPALLMFNFFFSIYHWPPIFDMAMSNFLAHNISHLLLMATSFCMWWPLICPMREYGAMSGLKKIGYIFMNGLLLTPACACIIFSQSTLYKLYTEGSHILCTPFYFTEVDIPRLIDFLTPYADQQLGGVIMKIMQELIYATVLGLAFFQWYRTERKEEIEFV